MRMNVKQSLAVSALALIAVSGGCKPAAQQGGIASASSNIPASARAAASFASEARRAMKDGNPAAAISFAERAVEAAPEDAGYRMLLGQAYMAAGRHVSADQALGDMLSLMPENDRGRIQQALARLAQGNRDGALTLLGETTMHAPPADLGLAYAFAGDPARAISILEPAARGLQSTPRTRQNLALSYALAGNWAKARAVASQDVAPGELDQRMQSWAELASPKPLRQQIAALLNVTPVDADPGQPAMLALHPQAADAPQFAEAAPAAPVEPKAPEVPAPAAVQPVEIAASAAPEQPVVDVVKAIELAATPAPAPAPSVVDAMTAAPVAEAQPALMPEAVASAVAAAAVPAVSRPSVLAAVPAPKPSFAPKKTYEMAGVMSAAFQPEAHRGPAPVLKSQWMVQLAAYARAARVEAGWAQLRGSFARLAHFDPSRSTFEVAPGKIYHRLAIGFASRTEAVSLCQAIKGRGGECFLRRSSQAETMQMAARRGAQIASR